MSVPELYKKEEAAQKLRVSVRKLECLMYAREIDYVKSGRDVRFTDRHLSNYIERNTVRCKGGN